MSWKTVLLCFRTWGLGGQNIQEVRELEDKLPEPGTPEGPLAPINSLPTMEAYRPLLSQNVLQAGSQISSKDNIQDVNWTLVWRGGRWSWACEQLELSERDAYQNSCSQRSHTRKKTQEKKRWQNRQWERWNLIKVERDRGQRFGKPPGGPFTNTSTWPSWTGEGQLLPVDVGIHKQNATPELAWIPKASLHLGMRLHPNRLSPRPPIKTTDIAGVFYLFIASWSRSTTRSTIPNAPSRKTSASWWWWIPGAAAITAYWNGEQLSYGHFVNALL